MVNNNYAKAYTEVLEIIKHFPKEEYQKIPNEKILFFEANMDKNYDFKIDPKIGLEKQNISEEANAIIIILFRDYYATEKQKVKLQEILEYKKKSEEKEKREKYNPDNFFNDLKENKEAKSDVIMQKTDLIEYKKTFFTRFKEFILRLLNIN